MKKQQQEQRKRQIEAAAYELLVEKGYKATSMLDIAKRASASNETLYNWYGTKQALFSSLVAANALEARKLFSHGETTDADPLEILQKLGPILLTIVAGEQAVALNRAAASDVYETGKLGQTIANGGKQAILPLLRQVFEQARERELVGFSKDDDVAETYVSLLIGDLQIERVIGVRPALTRKQIEASASKALKLILQLFPSS
jgi:AcrR family transcriptional regulator